MAIDAEVDLGLSHSMFTLAARLSVNLPGVDRQVAQELVEGAHQISPYSRATRGNIDVTLNVVYEVAKEVSYARLRSMVLG